MPHLCQPAKPALLIRSQRCLELRRRRRRWDGIRLIKLGEYVFQPALDLGFLDFNAVDGGRSGIGLERILQREIPTCGLLEELTGGVDLIRIEGNPLPFVPNQGLLERHQRLELIAAERLITQSHLPLVAQQRVPCEEAR